MKDAEIVKLFLNRNEDALSAVEEKYGAKLYRLAFSILDNAEDAKECVNDTYFQAWKLIPPNEPYDILEAFLSKITRSVAFDRYRAGKALKRSSVIVPITEELAECLPDRASVEDDVAGKELFGRINKYLYSKSKTKRNIFIRRYYFLDPVADISRRFGISESKVKVELYRMRNELKKELIKEGYTL